MKWVEEKPAFTEDCVLVTATKICGLYEYAVWEIKKIYSDEGWYMAWLTGDGEEYGDISDLKADLYCVLPNFF